MLRILGFIVAVSVVGCDGNTLREPEVIPATVTVTINKQPLPNAQVTFTPIDKKYGPNAVANGVTDDNGVAKLTCAGQPGACIGSNLITIAEGPMPDDTRSDDPKAQLRATQFLAKLKNRPIPPRYANLVESRLELEVKQGEAEYKIELQR